jgi:SHS2 domain-containing protein
VVEILEHTADIGFRASAATAAELFVESARAVQSIAVEASAAEPRQAHPLAASGESYPDLLVNWLSELLYYLDGARVVFARFEVDSVDPRAVAGRGWGEPRDDAKHPPRLVVKGVTYHLLDVRASGGLWHAQVILDI